MKLNTSLIILTVVLAVGCTQNKSENTSQTTDSLAVNSPEVVANNGKYCYLGVLSRDSMKLELERNGNVFSGFLFYNRYETDSSIGEFNGTISGDTLKGVFDFMAEGMISKIDKYFLLQNEKLVEAVGAFKHLDDYTLVFENPSELKYGETYTLEPTDCKPDFIAQKDKDVYYGLKK